MSKKTIPVPEADKAQSQEKPDTLQKLLQARLNVVNELLAAKLRAESMNTELQKIETAIAAVREATS